MISVATSEEHAAKTEKKIIKFQRYSNNFVIPRTPKIERKFFFS